VLVAIADRLGKAAPRSAILYVVKTNGSHLRPITPPGTIVSSTGDFQTKTPSPTTFLRPSPLMG
jgi:hypothetical protein